MKINGKFLNKILTKLPTYEKTNILPSTDLVFKMFKY